MKLSSQPDSQESQLTDRRSFLKRAAAGAGAAVLSGAVLGAARTVQAQSTGDAALDQDLFVLNFALNLEYLEAEYYTRGTAGVGIADAGIPVDGFGTQGTTVLKPGSTQVPFTTPAFLQFAQEIAADERAHVLTLRAAIAEAGSTPAAFPQVDLFNSFNTAAKLGGIAESFDPFANEVNFMVGAFVFEDVGVTAYRGGAPLLSNRGYLSAAAGILAVEGYHASLIRTLLFNLGADTQRLAQQISDLRDLVDTKKDKDQGVVDQNGHANIVPANENGIAYARSARQVLNIVYGGYKASKGGFFPNGANLFSTAA